MIPHDCYERYADDPKYESFKDWTTCVRFGDYGSLEYHLDAMELERLTGGDVWAKMALCRADVNVADIPEELRGDDATAERIAWLVRHIPQGEIDEAKAASAQLMIDLGLGPPDEENNSSDDRSNDR